MADLDACPHCGQAGFVRVKRWPWEKEGEPGLVWGYHVICDASGIDTHPRGCGASSGWGETPESAIAAWNRRAYLAASGEVAREDEHERLLRLNRERVRRHRAKKRALARAAPQPGQVAVKPLEWSSNTDDDEWYSDDDPTGNGLGLYWVFPSQVNDGKYELRIAGQRLGYVGTFPSPDAAKAAAQADYETRIRSALRALPRPPAPTHWRPLPPAPTAEEV